MWSPGCLHNLARSNYDTFKEVIALAGNATDDRKRAERAYKDALRDDPKEERQSTRQLKADFQAARSTELQQTGQHEQARSWF